MRRGVSLNRLEHLLMIHMSSIRESFVTVQDYHAGRKCRATSQAI